MEIPIKKNPKKEIPIKKIPNKKISIKKIPPSPWDLPLSYNFPDCRHPSTPLWVEDSAQASGKSLPSQLTGGEGDYLAVHNFVTDKREILYWNVIGILDNSFRSRWVMNG